MVPQDSYPLAALTTFFTLRRMSSSMNTFDHLVPIHLQISEEIKKINVD